METVDNFYHKHTQFKQLHADPLKACGPVPPLRRGDDAERQIQKIKRVNKKKTAGTRSVCCRFSVDYHQRMKREKIRLQSIEKRKNIA